MKDGLEEGLKGEVGAKSNNQGCKKRRVEGDTRVSTRGYEKIWILPQELVREITWRKEKRRCKLMAR